LTISRFEDQKRREEHIQNARRMQEKRLSALLSHEEAFLAKQVSLRDIKLQAEMVREEVRTRFSKCMVLDCIPELRSGRGMRY